MSKREKKKMAKAGLVQTMGFNPKNQKQLLRRAIREQKELVILARQLRSATIRADYKLADARAFITEREERLSRPAAGH